MKENPRLFIGTMYSGENEYEECKEMIFAQTYWNFEHFVYKDLNYKDAHDALYNEFMSKSDEFDIMIKVDADMVIREKTFFEWVINQFQSDNELDMLTMALHDFYLDDHIWGMHAYRNTVKWNTGNEIVYTDRMHVDATIRKHKWHHEIIADHCKDPSPFQAFHFGFHRALKAVQPGRIKAKLDGNYRKMEQVYLNYKKTGNIKLAFALAGAELMYNNNFKEENISYNDNLKYIFKNLFGKSTDELDAYITKCRSKTYRKLPYPYNYYFLFLKFRIKSFLFPIMHESSSEF